MRIRTASVFLLLTTGTTQAAGVFPYGTRTVDYSGWSPSARGDINTLGMSGATIGLGSSIAAAEANPAGYGMLTSSLSAQIDSLAIEDRQIQRSGDLIRTTQLGIAICPPPWGFSFAVYNPMNESGNYSSANSGRNLPTEIGLKEYRLSVARGFLDHRFSVGVSGEVVQAIRKLGPYSYDSHAFNYRVGALYRLAGHLTLGVMFAPSVTVKPSGNQIVQNDMPGFDRAVVKPMQTGAGLGWIPNRFFKTGFSLSYVGPTRNTALLADQNVYTGTNATWVPRLGASYVLAEYTNLKVEAAAGTYFESSRISDQPDRLHMTAVVEVNPYFMNLGVGFDVSKDYRNVLVQFGLDIVRTLRVVSVIPPNPVPAPNQWLPPPLVHSPDGLPDGLTHGQEKDFEGPSVGDIGNIIEEVPSNIVNKMSGDQTSVEKQGLTPEKVEREAAEMKADKKAGKAPVKRPAKKKKR